MKIELQLYAQENVTQNHDSDKIFKNDESIRKMRNRRRVSYVK